MAAARPENDKRADAVRLSGVPSRTTGTTVRALAEGTDPAPSCAPIGPTVWYRLPGSNGKTAVVLRALGQLEAVVGVYRIDRSHITGLGCSKTDAKGLAGLAFRARPRKTYLLLVGQREGSIPGKFELVVQKPESAARPPGRPLPEEGSWASVDRLLDPDDSWATDLVAGTTYMINLVASSERCLRFELYRSPSRHSEARSASRSSAVTDSTPSRPVPTEAAPTRCASSATAATAARRTTGSRSHRRPSTTARRASPFGTVRPPAARSIPARSMCATSTGSHPRTGAC